MTEPEEGLPPEAPPDAAALVPVDAFEGVSAALSASAFDSSTFAVSTFPFYFALAAAVSETFLPASPTSVASPLLMASAIWPTTFSTSPSATSEASTCS